MLHPHTVLRTVSDAIGVGVFATRRIPRGTITWVLDPLDHRLPEALVAAMPQAQRAYLDRYAWREDQHRILCWDHGRFLNHSCDPTCLGGTSQFEIAVRDIEEGEELTASGMPATRRPGPMPRGWSSPSAPS
jgi:uncharacterized protein